MARCIESSASGGVRGLGVQSDGKVVFAGNGVGSNGEIFVDEGFTVGRLNLDGSLDPNFATAGIFHGNDTLRAAANDLLIQKTGRIVIGGNAGNAFMAAGFTTSGALDPHFGFHGLFIYNRQSNGSNNIERLALLADGSILAVGQSADQGVLLELSPNGVLDSKIAGLNKVAIVIGAMFNIQQLVVDPQGRIVVANPNQVGRLNSNFTLDTTFWPGGVRTFDQTDLMKPLFIDAMTVLADGRAVLATSFIDGRGPLLSLRPDAGQPAVRTSTCRERCRSSAPPATIASRSSRAAHI